MKAGVSPPDVSSVGLVEYTSHVPEGPADSALAPAELTKLAPVPNVTPASPSIDAPAAMVRLPVPACITTVPAPVTGAFTLMA